MCCFTFSTSRGRPAVVKSKYSRSSCKMVQGLGFRIAGQILEKFLQNGSGFRVQDRRANTREVPAKWSRVYVLGFMI